MGIYECSGLHTVGNTEGLLLIFLSNIWQISHKLKEKIRQLIYFFFYLQRIFFLIEFESTQTTYLFELTLNMTVTCKRSYQNSTALSRGIWMALGGYQSESHFQTGPN